MPGALTARLMLGADEIGRVEDVELDEWVGWFRGRWSRRPGFAQVEDLFAEEAALARGLYDANRWRSVWERYGVEG
jgi:hypothetical protein